MPKNEEYRLTVKIGGRRWSVTLTCVYNGVYFGLDAQHETRYPNTVSRLINVVVNGLLITIQVPLSAAWSGSTFPDHTRRFWVNHSSPTCCSSQRLLPKT